MTKRSFGICILLIAILLCAALPVQAALAESTPVILLSGKTEGEEIVVTATLRNNDGISAMVLNLEYDREKLTLTDCKRGDGLSDLDLIPSGTYDVYPFRMSWSGDDNDTTNGVIVTFRFTVKEGADGDTTVKLTYDRDSGVNYYKAGDVATKNPMMDTLRIDLSSGEVTAFDSEGTKIAAKEAKNKKNLIIGLSVGGTLAILLIVLVPWFVVKKRAV